MKKIDELLKETELVRAIYVDKLMQIEKIRKDCKHEYFLGTCKFCKKEEEEL